jgi:hypothetical protein
MAEEETNEATGTTRLSVAPNLAEWHPPTTPRASTMCDRAHK